jgi:O-antigen/teichoic acid export membrane protein
MPPIGCAAWPPSPRCANASATPPVPISPGSFRPNRWPALWPNSSPLEKRRDLDRRPTSTPFIVLRAQTAQMTGKRLISYRYMVLRASTAAGTLGTGLLQTFVFARVLTPERFSLFIFFAALGYSLYLADVGIVKVLFVNLRGRFLQKKPLGAIAGQATMVFALYVVLAAIASAVCFLILAGRFHYSMIDSAELTLFFVFNAINLPWVALRYFSIAIDEYVYFEMLEALRRGINTVALLALLLGLPAFIFLLAINAGWIAVVSAAIVKLKQREAFAGDFRRNFVCFVAFLRSNRSKLFSSGVYALSETYIYNLPYFLAPWAFGLGAPTIILDTTFKVYRVANQFYSAACDSLVPRQTSALAERDGPAMGRATWLAAALCAIPAAAVCGLLIFAADKIFAVLLGPAAVMPPATTPIIIMLLVGNLAQMVSHSVLVHTGFFKEVARISFALVAVLTVIAAFAVWAHFDIVQFLNAYAAAYTCGALATVALMIRGPIRLAHDVAGAAAAARRSA